MTKYKNYKDIDFLLDEYFIQSMHSSTMENDSFWKKLIEEGEVDKDEFISAYMTFKNLSEAYTEIPKENINAVWKRLQKATSTKKQRKLKRKQITNTIAASALITLISVSLYTLYNKDKNNQINHRQISTRVVNLKQADDFIKIASGDDMVKLEGDIADIVFDKNGLLLLNQNIAILNKKNTKEQILPEYSKLYVPYGKRANLTLSDETQLWVNSGTTVLFPTVFTANKREIFVDGEIFADVSHNKNKPFFVITDKLKIEVLGTKFNVSTYQNDISQSVVLVEGALKVHPLQGSSYSIFPGQLFSFQNNQGTLQSVEVENHISWRDGRYLFKSEPIEQILLKLARYYNVTMILPSESSGITCSGKLELKEDLDALLYGLSEITSMTYATKGDEYRIKFE